MKPQETDCSGPTNPHPSLADLLTKSDDYPYLAHPLPQQSMDDPNLANPHPSLTNQLVDSQDRSHLAQQYTQQPINGPNLTDPYPAIVNFLSPTNNCLYLPEPYLQRQMDSSGATNTSLSSSSWPMPSAATASVLEPQTTMDSCDDPQASVSSSYPASYPFPDSSFSTKVPVGFQISPSAEASPHTSGPAHSDVTVAGHLTVWEDGPPSGFYLSDSVSQDIDSIASIQLMPNNCQ